AGQRHVANESRLPLTLRTVPQTGERQHLAVQIGRVRTGAAARIDSRPVVQRPDLQPRIVRQTQRAAPGRESAGLEAGIFGVGLAGLGDVDAQTEVDRSHDVYRHRVE